MEACILCDQPLKQLLTATGCSWGSSRPAPATGGADGSRAAGSTSGAPPWPRATSGSGDTRRAPRDHVEAAVPQPRGGASGGRSSSSSRGRAARGQRGVATRDARGRGGRQGSGSEPQDGASASGARGRPGRGSRGGGAARSRGGRHGGAGRAQEERTIGLVTGQLIGGSAGTVCFKCGEEVPRRPDARFPLHCMSSYGVPLLSE